MILETKNNSMAGGRALKRNETFKSRMANDSGVESSPRAQQNQPSGKLFSSPF